MVKRSDLPPTPVEREAGALCSLARLTATLLRPRRDVALDRLADALEQRAEAADAELRRAAGLRRYRL